MAAYTAYTKILDDRTITDETLEDDREACLAIDQARELTAGSKSWGIVYQGGQRGQMSRYQNGRGAIATGGDSMWGDWVPAVAPDRSKGEDMLATESGEFYSEYGEPVCQHGFSLLPDSHRTCDCR